MKKKYPYNFSTHSLFLLYKFLWLIFSPLVVLYFLKRSIKEPGYRKNLKERLGFTASFTSDSLWIHAVSLGEFRASVPLIRELLSRSEKITLTTITPAGRDEANKILKSDIKDGNICVVYLPLEYDFAFNRFLKRLRPRLAIVLEIELWPVMISACSRYQIPLILAQGQYVKKSFLTDKRWPWLRGALFNGFDLILAKSQVHATRYKVFCKNPVEVMGELRFDQAIPKDHLTSANIFLERLDLTKASRLCFCFGSTGPGEDMGLISLMNRLNKRAVELDIPQPFYVYVPRHRNNFSNVYKDLESSGLIFLKRTDLFDEKLFLKDKAV